MSKALVIKPGFLTTVQDAGRPQFQQSGISVSGVMDRNSHRCANMLVGNPLDEAVLEATLLGPTLEFDGESVIAITGGLTKPRLNDKPMPMWQSIRVKNGDTLSLPMPEKGCRVYIAFAGGINVPVVMESKSTNLNARIGGMGGRALCQGDELKLNALGADLRNLTLHRIPEKFIPQIQDNLELRVVLGPQDDAFTREGLDAFLSGTYTVSQDSNRMGYRLEGGLIQHRQGGDIISDGIVMGAVQVPGNGKPIILMADRQTTGGYTKIATVITPDLPKLGQARPGDSIRFKAVSIQQAQSLLLDMERQMTHLRAQLESTKTQLRAVVNGRTYHVVVEEIG